MKIGKLYDKRALYYSLIISYLALLFALPSLNKRSSEIVTILFASIPMNAICGILVVFQAAILFHFVLLFGEKGYKTALYIGTFSILFKFVPIFAYGELSSVVGIFMISIALGINVIIYSYINALTIQNDKLKNYNYELGNKQESLHKLAYFDYLTNLPNRRNVLKTIKNLCEDKDIIVFSLIVIDIKNFKKINDISGHQRGDFLLKELVESWKTFLNPKDILGRIDGDEFALIIPRSLSSDELISYGTLFKEEVSRIITLSAHLGIVSYPGHGQTADDLLKFAETALYSSQTKEKDDIIFFNHSMYEAMSKKTLMESELTHAIENNECYLVYQPQYTSDDNRLRGVETLVRWNSKIFGHVSPLTFITLAEETGYILELGEWILRKACTDALPLVKASDTHFTLSINVSALQILHTGFVQTIKEVLEETAFPADHLEFEITESIYINEKEKVSRILSELKELGVTIALDDFGTNYSSLSYIKEMPIDIIKIDKSFIDTIEVDIKKANLVDAILAIGKLLDFKVVAEGVETNKQLDYLKKRNCDFIQGYLFSKPVSVDIVLDSLVNASQKCVEPAI